MIAGELGSDIFNAQPNPIRARLLRKEINSLLRDGLRESVTVARAVLPEQADAAASAVEALDVNRRIAPGLYSLRRQISSGIRDQNVSQVALGLARLRLRHDHGELFADDRELSTLRWDECDQETAHYLYSPAGPRGPKGELPEMLPIPSQEYEQHADAVRRALNLLSVTAPDMHGEVSELVTSIRVYDQRHIGSVSSPRSFGLMHIHTPTSAAEISDPTACFVDRITHETSHIALNAVMTQDPLVLNDPAERFSSPLRRDPRPLSGIYHGTFVLSRVVHVLRLTQPHHDTPGLATTLASLTAAFHDAHSTVTKHGNLSPAGHEILDSCLQLATQV